MFTLAARAVLRPDLVLGIGISDGGVIGCSSGIGDRNAAGAIGMVAARTMPWPDLEAHF